MTRLSATSGSSMTNPTVGLGKSPTADLTGGGLGHLAEWSELRDESRIRHEDAQAGHRRSQVQAFHTRAAMKRRHGVPDLLKELAEDRGLAWSTIARIVGVSVSALRKWRRGGAATPENRAALARLSTMLDLIDEYHVTDPASWLEMPFDLPAGYRIRPVDLYQAGHYDVVLDLASLRSQDIEQVLDEIWGGWRDNRTDWEVFDAPDGGKAIRPRSD